MLAVRYRRGIDAQTGKWLVGRAHLAQSIATLWGTRLGERVMRLAYGSNLRSHLAEDVTSALALEIFDDLTTALRTWEPEYRVRDWELVALTRIGGLGVRHAGDYFPEGRFGNYAIRKDFGVVSPLARYEAIARRGAS